MCIRDSRIHCGKRGYRRGRHRLRQNTYGERTCADNGESPFLYAHLHYEELTITRPDSVLRVNDLRIRMKQWESCESESVARSTAKSRGKVNTLPLKVYILKRLEIRLFQPLYSTPASEKTAQRESLCAVML